jgi:hypothetical protein
MFNRQSPPFGYGRNGLDIEISGRQDEGGLIMIKEEDVLAALDRPRAVYALLQRLDPSSKSTEPLQDLLLRMRAAGKVKFDIKTGHWSKA